MVSTGLAALGYKYINLGEVYKLFLPVGDLFVQLSDPFPILFCFR